MASTVDDARERARSCFNRADFQRSLQTALEGLSASPDDVGLLILAGRAGVEVDDPDATEHLRRATELAPDNAEAWHHLGEAMAADGRMADADGAFRRAVDLDPEDQVALSHLGHTAVAGGRNEEGVGYLARAADIAHGAPTAVISLVDMYRSLGKYDEALVQARRVADAAPADVLAWLDVAELSLAVGQLDDAYTAFERLRELDDVPGHEAYPLHGMIQVEIRRQQWERARALAAQAEAIDPQGRSTDLAAFLSQQLEGTDQAPASAGAEVEAGLGSSLEDYRRTLADDRHLAAGDLLG